MELVRDHALAREYVPPGGAHGTVVYLHGGGWGVGSIESVDRLVRILAVEAGARVLSVGYRLAPEHPYPAGLEDAETVLRWAAARFDGPLAVAGDSAGANLATVAARRAGVPLALQALFYPVCDLGLDTPSYREFGDGGYRLTRDDMAFFAGLYGGSADDPDVSPLRAPLEALRGSPPAYVITCSHDVLRDEGEAYAARLREAGVAVELRRWPGMVHGFLRWPAVVDAARDGLREAGARLRAALLSATRESAV
jgi:acetyl esterase